MMIPLSYITQYKIFIMSQRCDGKIYFTIFFVLVFRRSVGLRAALFVDIIYLNNYNREVRTRT